MEIGQVKVKCYYNLHKKCFSIVVLEGDQKGRVISHQPELVLHDVTFKVSEAGRQRVIREQRKNVHAYVIGRWNEVYPLPIPVNPIPVTYNPYKYSSFVVKASEQPITAAKVAYLKDRQILALL